MSTYVMSDFHGRHDFFMRMLEKIDFSENDTLYILGDVADRGPDGIKTFMYIMDKPNTRCSIPRRAAIQAMDLPFPPRL